MATLLSSVQMLLVTFMLLIVLQCFHEIVINAVLSLNSDYIIILKFWRSLKLPLENTRDRWQDGIKGPWEE